MTDGHDELSDEAFDRSWKAFHARLADRLAELAHRDELLLEAITGATYVRLRRSCSGIEVETPDDGEVVLSAATMLDGACAATRLLRVRYGVPHPALLVAGGLEDPPGDEVAREPVTVPVRGDDVVVAATREELRACVDATLVEMLGEVEHDDEGDARCPAGLSVIFVRVLDNACAIRLFAEVVVEPGRLERVADELEELNRSHPFAKFHLAGGAVHLTHHLVARPYVLQHLRMVLAYLLGEVDELAAGIAERLGGRRFLEEPEPEHDVPVRPVNPGYSDTLGLSPLTDGRSGTRRVGLEPPVEGVEPTPTGPPYPVATGQAQVLVEVGLVLLGVELAQPDGEPPLGLGQSRVLLEDLADVAGQAGLAARHAGAATQRDQVRRDLVVPTQDDQDVEDGAAGVDRRPAAVVDRLPVQVERALGVGSHDRLARGAQQLRAALGPDRHPVGRLEQGRDVLLGRQRPLEGRRPSPGSRRRSGPRPR